MPSIRLTARLRRLLIFGALGGIALIGLIWAFAPRPIPVDIGVVERGPMAVELAEEAKTRIREIYVVSAPVGGRLERVEVEPGDPVAAAETIVAAMSPAEPILLDRRTQAELQSAVSAAEAGRDAAAAEVRRAQSAYEQAQMDFERDQRLIESGTIAPARYDATALARDTARAAWDAAREVLRAREADLARARAALMGPSEGEGGRDTLVLSAPVGGAVLEVFQESSAVVPAGAPVLSIGDPRDLEIVSEMLSVDAVRVRAGARVRIDGWGGPDLEGRVERVEPAAFTKVSALGVEEQRVNVIVDILSPRDEWLGLAHLFRVDVHVQVWREADVVQIPAAAVFRQDGDWTAFVIRNGLVETQTVELGEMNDAVAQVLAGVGEGESVVLHPSNRIEDGVRVRPREAADPR